MSFKIFAIFLFFSKNSAEVPLRDIAKNEINQNLALSVKNNFLTIIILLYPKTICEQIIETAFSAYLIFDVSLRVEPVG